MPKHMFISPSRYVQGRGLLSDLPTYTEPFGDVCLAVLSDGGAKRLAPALDAGCEAHPDCAIVTTVFSGECTMADAQAVADEALDCDAGCIVGIGGGKVIDTAKVAADLAGLPVVIAPTAASSDAPCSALAIVYNADGTLDCVYLLPQNPDVVLCDEDVIAAAPARLLSAGIGDAYATWLEARESLAADADIFPGIKATAAAEAIAHTCHYLLVRDGAAAVAAAERNEVTPELSCVIEANTLLSGIGFESCGVAAAHPVAGGIHECARARGMLHGETVAFGVLTQLALSSAEGEFEEALAFLRSVKLPVTLEELGFEGGPTDEELDAIVAVACSQGSTKNLPVPTDEAAVRAAILRADELGRAALAD